MCGSIHGEYAGIHAVELDGSEGSFRQAEKVAGRQQRGQG